MGLTLLAGPANAGKIELLLDRYLSRLDDEPVLIVPNGSDVEARERDLLRRRPALLGGSIGTFDDLFRRLAAGHPGARRVATDAQRALVGRAAVARAELNGLSRSARFGGFADSLVAVIGELESGMLAPGDLDGDLGSLYTAYRAELDRLGLWDRDLQRAAVAERLASDLSAWSGAPVFAYGFEDLTAAEWSLLEALAARTDVTVSLPYEPGRAAFASVTQTATDLSALAQGRIEELPPRASEYAHTALAHLERSLFADRPPPPVPIDGALRFFEGAGTRGTLELLAEELLALIRGGTAPEAIAVVCPSLERLRAPLETALGTLEVPHAIEARARLGQTPLGAALLSLVRFAWLDGTRGDLYAYLRSPFSGATRTSVDYAEGRLRGRAISEPEQVTEETERLREAPIPGLAGLRGGDPVDALRELLPALLRAAHGTEGANANGTVRGDLRAYEAAAVVLDELEAFARIGGRVTREDAAAALERATVRGASAGEPGRVAVLDLLRARTRRFEAVFVLGLEEGSLPRRGQGSPFLDDDGRKRLGRRLERPDGVERDRYLFYTACTRATRRLYLVREAATDEGVPREPSPFWEEARAAFDPEDAARWTRRRALSALTWPLEAAPTDRERLRSLAVAAETDRDAARAIAAANGWDRPLTRALAAFRRPTQLRHPLVLERLRAKTTFNVTELERMADCSSAWLVERFLDPRTIDAEVDAKLRGSIAHTALSRFFGGLPKELGIERPDEAHVEDAVRFMRACLDDALKGIRMELSDLARRELDASLWRDLEQLVRAEAAEEAPFVPRRFEVGFGTDRSAPELQRGLDVGGGTTVSGKIDRIDVDPFSARGIVVDYKSGKSAHSAQEIEDELRLQVPLYMLVLRDLVGIEPLGGVYRPLGGARRARGLLRSGGPEERLEGFVAKDYRDEEAFWAQVEGARAVARDLAGRIHGGDVRHDPRGGACPAWCDLWNICRVQRT